MRSNNIAVGAIIGATVGVVAGMLTAPKSGRETRDDIKRKSSELKGQANAKKDTLLFKVEEISDDVRTKAADAIDSLKPTGKK